MACSLALPPIHSAYDSFSCVHGPLWPVGALIMPRSGTALPAYAGALAGLPALWRLIWNSVLHGVTFLGASYAFGAVAATLRGAAGDWPLAGACGALGSDAPGPDRLGWLTTEALRAAQEAPLVQ